MAIGISKAGLDFKCRDGHPARVIILFLGHPRPSGEELVMLKRLSSALAKPDVSRRLGESLTDNSDASGDARSCIRPANWIKDLSGGGAWVRALEPRRPLNNRVQTESEEEFALLFTEGRG